MSDAHARVSLSIHGVVQGVWFRASTREQAERLGLVGWVRNEPDGSVSAVAEGPREAVEKLVAWCHQGPPGARVDRVDAQWSQSRGDVKRFEIRR